MTKNLLSKIAPFIVGIGILAGIGCCSTTPKNKYKWLKQDNGYIIESLNAESNLKIAAGIMKGTIKVYRHKDGRGYILDGSFFGAANDYELFKKVCILADINGDKFIFEGEAENFINSLCEEATE